MKDPFWKHVTKLSGYTGGGGSGRWRCNYCGMEKTGSVTRVKDHLAHVPNKDIGPCQNVPTNVRSELDVWRSQRLGLINSQEEESIGGSNVNESMPQVPEQKRRRVDSRGQAHPTQTTNISSTSSGPPSQPTASRTPLPRGSLDVASVKAHLQKQAMKEATREITRLFIRCAIPFNVAKTNQWKKTMKAVSRIGCEWEGPSGETLRTRELKKEKLCVEESLTFLQDTWTKYGCTILCDGWSDVRKRNVYNVLISSCKGTMFWKAIDASGPGLAVTGEFIWGHIKAVIQEIGPQHVVQVVTDNGSNCVSMGRMLEGEFPTIVWTPCASHCLDLLMEDIAKLYWVHDIFQVAKSMVKFVTRRPKVLSIYRANTTLELLKPSRTRFAYMFIVLERLIRVRPNLIRTISCDEWLGWDKITLPKFVEFRRHVFNETWWGDADSLVKSLKPIFTVLRITDMEGSTQGLLYEYMDKIGEALGRNVYLPPEKVDELRLVWNSRWDWFHKPIHAVANVLHPLWRSDEQYACNELESGFMQYVQKWCAGDLEMLVKIEDDLLAFRNHSGTFGRLTAKLRETQLQPVSWWEKYGNCAPTLKRLAIRVLSQDCSSGPCERNWSTWALFHTKKRNRLTTLQLERLVYCNCNLKLLERLSGSPEPRQVNVDNIDIEKVQDLPDIPQDERDMYSLLYEEAIMPVHDMRSRTRQQRGGVASVGTSRAVLHSSSSEASDDTHSSEQGSTADDSQDTENSS